MQFRCPKSKVYDTGAVIGYQLEFNKVATLVKDKNAVAPCVLWEITKQHELSLDKYEGYPYKYGKRMVEVQTTSGEKLKAMAYIMNDSSRLDVPKDDYFERISDGYAAFELDEQFLEDAYGRAIEATEKRLEHTAQLQNRPPFEDQDDIDRYRVEGFRAAMEYATYIGMLDIEDVADVRDSDIRNIIGNYYPRQANYMTLYQKNRSDNEYTYYIAYGSNIDPNVMKYRCPKSQLVGISTLKDYKLAFDTHATIEKGAVTPVALWKIHKDDWRSLDVYEGYPSYYRREKKVVQYKGEVIDAVIYIMNREGKTYRPPAPSYVENVKKGYTATGMNVDYLNAALRESLAWWDEATKKNSKVQVQSESERTGGSKRRK